MKVLRRPIESALRTTVRVMHQIHHAELGTVKDGLQSPVHGVITPPSAGRFAGAFVADLLTAAFAGDFSACFDALVSTPRTLLATFLSGAFFALACCVAPSFALGSGGTLAPSLRASLRPIEIACLRLVTFSPLLPLFSAPVLSSCNARPIVD